MTIQEVGYRIMIQRRARSLSQAEFASLCGISRPSLSNLEHGAQNVPFSTVNRAAEAFGITLKELLFGESIPELKPRPSGSEGGKI